MTGLRVGCLPVQANGQPDPPYHGQDRGLDARRSNVHLAALLPRASVWNGAAVQRRRDDLLEPRADERGSREARRAERPSNPEARAAVQPGAHDSRHSRRRRDDVGSGIDPDISPAYAALQARRVAAVRHLPLATVQQLIKQNTDGRSLGFFGEPGVNVLELNLALDGR